MREFDGRVAVVTGAASGIGRAFAERFARAGMKVVLADLEAGALDTAVQALRQQELDVLGVQADVARPEAVEELAQRALDAYGPKIHLVCNNAGVMTDNEVRQMFGGPARPLWEEPLADWRWTFDVNLWGIVYGIHTFVPLMLRHGEEGHLVNTASMAGLASGPNLPIYGATKHAVVRISEALYFQLAARQAPIHVSVVCPAAVNTRIALATRNRPGERPPDDELERLEQATAEFTSERGLTSEAVAETVFAAIQEERFCILPHDVFGVDLGNARIRPRMENILARRNP
jgi:NAD(P)-dependent dehydrogenase (short-subunit alcohol dehydrogenase family)